MREAGGVVREAERALREAKPTTELGMEIRAARKRPRTSSWCSRRGWARRGWASPASGRSRRGRRAARLQDVEEEERQRATQVEHDKALEEQMHQKLRQQHKDEDRRMNRALHQQK